jgi:hypothetical protein
MWRFGPAFKLPTIGGRHYHMGFRPTIWGFETGLSSMVFIESDSSLGTPAAASQNSQAKAA